MYLYTGKSYEELNIGDNVSFIRTISDEDVIKFAELTGDFNPIHIDDTYAKTTRFKKRIAHGVLSQGFISMLLGTELPGVGTVIVEMSCKYKLPVFIGDTITTTVNVKDKIESKKWVIMSALCVNQNGDTTTIGEVLIIPPVKGKEK